MDERPPRGAALRALIGTVIAGKYQVRSVIGSGGMGTVFEGKHVVIGRIVAIKILNPESVNAVTVKRFHQEAWAAGSIGHPNVCEVSDLGALPDGSPYLVMERLYGETLSERLARVRRLSIEEGLSVVTQVLAALDAVHARGLLHRDIKPENVFLFEREGFPSIVKVLDFGVSKVIASSSKDEWDDKSALTKTGVVMGTPYYVSPEQARAMRDLDPRTDVYSCGVLLYEALTGKRPFEANHYNALLLRIVQGKPTRPSALRSDMPAAVEAAILRAMAIDRSERFATAGDFGRALAALKP